MAEQAAPIAPTRSFSTCELAVLRARHVAEADACRFPAHLSAVGICDLLEAGVLPEIARAADPSLSAVAIRGFLLAGADLTDVDYDDRFIDPRFLADAGLAASVANAYPHHLSDIDIVRLHDARFGPRDSASFDAATDVAEVVKLAATGVTPEQARAYRNVPGLPTEMIGRCVRSGADPEALADWMAIVGSAIRTNPATLLHTALACKRLDDPLGFRFDLLRVAARSVLAAANDPEDCRLLAQLLLDVVQYGGALSTTIPDSWTRERLLFVGPDAGEVVTVVIIPDEPLSFSYGDLDFDDAIGRIGRYVDRLRQASPDSG